MESQLSQVVRDAKELDSELLEAKSTVKGVLTADRDGLVLKADGDIDRRLGRLAAALTRQAQQLEPLNDESPSIVLETATAAGERGQIIVRRENDLNVAIEKKQASLPN